MELRGQLRSQMEFGNEGKMTTRLAYAFAIFLFLFASVLVSSAQIVPPNWVDPKALESAEAPIQNQLDTGKGMNASAWSLAAVRNARLFAIYMLLYQKLDKSGQNRLYNEQDAWLNDKSNQLKKLRDPSGGSDVGLDIANKDMELTDQRIKVLSARLKKLGSNL